jgi:hypothetical protein
MPCPVGEGAVDEEAEERDEKEIGGEAQPARREEIGKGSCRERVEDRDKIEVGDG